MQIVFLLNGKNISLKLTKVSVIKNDKCDKMIIFLRLQADFWIGEN